MLLLGLLKVELEPLALVVLHVGAVGLLVLVASAEVAPASFVEDTVGVLLAVLGELVIKHGLAPCR